MEPDDRGDSGGVVEHQDDTIAAGAGSATLFEDRAPHVDDAFEETIMLCRDTVLSDTGPAYISYYTVGVYAFSVDTMEDVNCDFTSTAGTTMSYSVKRVREDYRRTGGKVAFSVTDLDQMIEDVRTGTVIRLVLHASEGMVICCPVIPKDYIVAVTVDQSARPAVGVPLTDLPGTAADGSTADLVTACRERLGLRTQDPGGWLVPRSTEIEPGESHEGSQQLIGGVDQQSIADLCRASIDTDDLHYVAYCRGTDIVSTADHLGHRRISRFFTQITPEARRKFYGDFSRRFSPLASKFGRMVASVIGSPVQRIVIDVQQGAIYYYRLRMGEYLIGVTLDQRGVGAADRKMAALALRCAALLPNE